MDSNEKERRRLLKERRLQKLKKERQSKDVDDEDISTDVQTILAGLKKTKTKMAKLKSSIERPGFKRETVTFVNEVDDPGEVGVKYYYPSPQDFERFNLPIRRRPWPGGREGFDNAMEYRPGMIYDYVQENYIDYFNNKGLPSPFAQSEQNIDRTTSEICDFGDEIILQPHQKFVGAHMSNLTDFGSLLLYHKLGSGKSASSIAIAESNKGIFLDDGDSRIRPGSCVPQKMAKKQGYKREPCHITVVVPAATIAQYEGEIRGRLENGALKSFSGSCVVYSEDIERTSMEEDGKNYRFFRQFYTGKYHENGQPWSPAINELSTIGSTKAKYQEEKDKLEYKTINNEQLNNDEKNREAFLTEAIKKLEQEEKIWTADINKSISKIYYIVSHQSFLNTVTVMKKFGRIKDYIAKPYLLGESNSKLPHPDCFHSKKSVVIIDEPQKMTTEAGTNFLRLYDTLNFYARDQVTGKPRMKVILLTATPIYDNPHEASLMINFQRPRIPFPLSRLTFENFFIDKENKDNIKMKNKLCYQYLTSGYVSYSQGANPKGFPIRRNIIQLHTLADRQLTGYTSSLKYDVTKDESSDKQFKDNNKFYDKQYKQAVDDNQQGRYLRSRMNCNISYPIDGKLKRKTVSEEEKSKVEKESYPSMERLMTYLTTLDRKQILPTFRSWSKKFHFILDKIVESSKKNEGPIVVHSEWVPYGILPMIKILQLIGWKLFEDFDKPPGDIVNSTKREKSRRDSTLSFGNIAVWSIGAEEALGLKKYKDYNRKAQKLFNSKENINGEVIKVFFITVSEGVSFKRVSQLHVTAPWWNESKTEQIVGRGIRFCSHADLPIDRQYVDVYYHCSVLPIFDQYPKVDVALAVDIANALQSNHSSGGVKQRIPKKGTNFKDLARLTIEQKVYITARRKNDINNQFEQAIKETSVDCHLNKFGNLVRFEDVVNTKLRMDMKPGDKLLYDRSKNEYYMYNIKTDELLALELDRSYNDESQGNRPVWPAIIGRVLGNVNRVEKWAQFKAETIEIENDVLLSLIVTEETNCFNNDPMIRDLNFKELMSYAVKEKKEELDVWKYFEDQRLRKGFFEILVGLLGLSEGRGEQQFKEVLKDVLDNDDVIRGTSFKNQLAELYQLSDSPQFQGTIKERLKKPLILKKPLSTVQLKKSKERYKRLFYTGYDDVAKEQYIEEMKNKLITKYGWKKSDIAGLNPMDIEAIYTDRMYQEREEDPKAKSHKGRKGRSPKRERARSKKKE